MESKKGIFLKNRYCVIFLMANFSTNFASRQAGICPDLTRI